MAAMPSIAIEDIERHAPDVLLPPDPEFAEDYAAKVELGRTFAAEARVALVAICRNAMPWLPRTLDLVERTGAAFASWSAFVFENDSEDGTKDVLKAWADGDRRKVSLNIHHRPHLSHTIAQERTVALAEYREQCQHWVRSREPVDYVIVFDTDPWGGFSIDGVMNSIAWLALDRSWYGLASYSWCEMNTAIGPIAAHYDAFAARLNHWGRRDQQWFHHWHPAVGSPPVEFNSAFGQLCVYRADPYLSGKYGGSDCEHAVLHRSIAEQARLWSDEHYRLGLNPSSRAVSFWVPTDGGQHGGD
jgi:hypothetical protein